MVAVTDAGLVCALTRPVNARGGVESLLPQNLICFVTRWLYGASSKRAIHGGAAEFLRERLQIPAARTMEMLFR